MYDLHLSLTWRDTLTYFEGSIAFFFPLFSEKPYSWCCPALARLKMTYSTESEVNLQQLTFANRKGGKSEKTEIL